MLSKSLAFLVRLLSGVWIRKAAPFARKSPVIYFANHGSNLDTLVVWATLPPIQRCITRPLAARDYWNKGVLRRFLATRVFRAILIERKVHSAKRNPLEIVVQALEKGDSVVIYPEGTRSLSGQIAEFKGGIYHLARDLPDVPLVPVYLENMNRILPKGEFLPVPVLCSVVFGEAQQLQPDETKREFLARMRSELKQLRKDARG